MEDFDVSELFKVLFTTPVQSLILAEREYRKIWMEYIDDVTKQLEQLNIGKDSDNQKKAAIIKSALSMAPVMNFEAAIEVESMMRISGTKEKSVNGGLQLSVFHVSGRYSSSNRQESSIKAKAIYNLSNTKKISLIKYLEVRGINPEDEESLKKSKALLKGKKIEVTNS